MKIFISYRRDDTAGRAGRLVDVLVARFGARNVFQDVTAIAPGMDFAEQVDRAIAQSGAVLVVVGSDWLSMRAPDGTRRLDEPDDYVRREVGAALAAGVRVVPVLVDRAELPAADDLPEALRPLATRQAVALRDATWHQDVDGLVRRLEGDELVEPPRRQWLAVVGATVALIAAGPGGWIWLSDDDTGDADSSDETAPVTDLDTEPIFYSGANFDTLFVDEISQNKPVCFSIVSGNKNVDPGKRAIALVGFASTEDPTDAPLSLRTNGGLEIPIPTGS